MATATLLPQTRTTKPLARLAWVTLGFFLLVVLWGAVVRATGSGGGCGSNWPLCNGDYFPRHPRLATVIEFTHRSTSGICTFLLIALGVFTFRVTPPGHRARKAVLWAGFLLVTEALLGAMLVLRHWVEANVSTGRVLAHSVHLTNTMLFMGSLALTALFLTPREQYAATLQETQQPIAALAIVSTLLVAATGSLAALADTLFPSPNLCRRLCRGRLGCIPHPHPHEVAAPRRGRPQRRVHPSAFCAARPSSAPLARAVAGLLALQFLLGVGDVLLLAPIWMQVLHLLSADLYWIALVLLTSDIFWPYMQSKAATLT